MKKQTLFFAGFLFLIACNSITQPKKTFSVIDIAADDYKSFGNKVTSEDILYQNAITSTYENLKEGDTLEVSFTSSVNGVCKAKGCWMKLALGGNKETMVKFKDYGFFVPKDIENDTVIVQGKAFVNEMSVEEQQHFARDAGRSEEEIAAITQPKMTYSFVAEGVLIKK